MRIAVMGAGGLGGFFGGLLARAGHEVFFIARGTHLRALQERGLTVKSRLAGDFTLPVLATDNPATIGPVDLVLFCVKTYDIPAAAMQIRPLIGPQTMVLPVQNGIDHPEKIAAIVGAEHVLGGVVYIFATIENPGTIVQSAGPGRLIFGELEATTSARTEHLLEVLRQAGIAAEHHPQIRVAMWEKYIFICGYSGVTALTRLPIGPILACPETRTLLNETMAEVHTLARAVGIPVAADHVEQLMTFVESMEPAASSSLAYDLAHGRRLELDALNGTVVRLGHQHGVAVPRNEVIYAALKPFAKGLPALP